MVHVFDLDGTLLDSNTVWADIDREYLKKYGIDGADCTKLASLTYDELYTALRALSFPDIGIDRLKDELDETAVHFYGTSVPEKKEVTDHLKALFRKGKRTVLFTGSPERLYRPALERIGIIELFSDLYSTDVTGFEKSDPRAWTDLAERLGVSVKDLTVYEDSPAALSSAGKAGVGCRVWVEDRFSGKPSESGIYRFSDYSY